MTDDAITTFENLVAVEMAADPALALDDAIRVVAIKHASSYCSYMILVKQKQQQLTTTNGQGL